MKNITITQWAFNLATLCNSLAETAKPYQAAYKAGTPEQQHQLRVEWRVGYIMGKCGVDAIKAAQIAGQTRAERSAKHEAAVNLANKQFATYVSCTSTRATGTKPQSQVAIPRALKSELASLIEAYGVDVVRAALKAAK
jgi:hypothetical protein